MGYCLGVDVGASCVAVAVARGPEAELVRLGVDGPFLPVSVYLDDDGTLLAGEAAEQARLDGDPDRGCAALLRRLGDPNPVLLGGQSYAAAALLGTLLHHALQTAVELEGSGPDRVALAYPARWGTELREALLRTARFAGLVDPLLVPQPDAVGARFARSGPAEGELRAVYDLGGGSLELSVLRYSGGEGGPLGLPGGIARLGGIDFDRALVERIREVGGEAFEELDRADRAALLALGRLGADCARAKEELSVADDSRVAVELPSGAYDVHISRADLEYVIRPALESTIRALHRTLHAAGISADHLTGLTLQGGSSRIPLVATLLDQAVGCEVTREPEPRGAVALGTALIAAQEPGRRAPSLLSSRYRQAAAGRTALAEPPPRPSAPPAPSVPTDTVAAADPAGPSAGGRNRGPAVVAVATTVAVLLVAAIVLLVRLRGATLELSHTEVPIGTSYLATASGFEPGEPVRFSWTGPTSGVMMPAAADAGGRAVEGPILERDPPGHYTIVVTGVHSGRTARTDLQVQPGRLPPP